MNAPTLDFYLFVGSLYSYPSVMRIGAAAAQAGVGVRWCPFNLRAILAEVGPPQRSDRKMAYTWRDLERRAARFGLPYTPGPPYPVDPDLLANRVAALACGHDWGPDFVTGLFEGWFAGHRPPGDRAVLAGLLTDLGQDAAALLASAESDAGQAALERGTQDAGKLGIFGAPTFAVGTEIFWGDDRLEDALDWAIAHAAG